MISNNDISKFFDHYPFPAVINVEEYIGNGIREPFDFVDDANIIFPEDTKRKPKKSLIVGCGYNEALYHALRNPKISYYALDISNNAVEHNKKVIKESNIKNLEVVNQDLIEAKNENYDLIYAKNVVSFVNSPLEALKHLSGCLSDDGALILSVPNAYHFSAVNFIRPLLRNLEFDLYDLESVKDAFELIKGLGHNHPSAMMAFNKEEFIPLVNFISLFLTPKFNIFTIQDLFDLYAKSGLFFQNWYDNVLYYPSTSIRHNQDKHPGFYKKINSLDRVLMWDSVGRIFGSRRNHQYHTMCLRKKSDYEFFPYNLFNNAKTYVSLSPSQMIKTPEGVDSVFAVRANIRMKLSPEHKKIIDLLDKPQLVSSLLESKKISSINDQRSDALLDLFEASVVRFHL